MAPSTDNMPPKFVYKPRTVSYKSTLFDGKSYYHTRTLKGRQVNPEYLRYIKEFMKKHKMTYVEYAKRLKCSKNMISRAKHFET